MKNIHRYLFMFVLLLWSTGCAPQAAEPPASTITVMAAASLTGAFQELGQRFEQQHPGSKVRFNFAGSQQLAQQLAQGAAADVFASANLKQMEAVISSGRIAANGYHIFAQNRLVIVLPKENPGNLSEWKDLAKPGITLVLAASEVPAGAYSLEFLKKASQDYTAGPGFQESVQKNIVSYEDNIKAVLTKVALGEADAGIVYTSDVTGSAAAQVIQVQIPDALNVIASYPMAVIKDSPQPQMAQFFVDLVLSQQGQDILEKYGFLPATE